MIAATVVYQALVRQRFIFLEPSVRAMVRSIPPIWLVKGSSVDEGDVKKLWNLLDSDAWYACPERGSRWLASMAILWTSIGMRLTQTASTGI